MKMKSSCLGLVCILTFGDKRSKNIIASSCDVRSWNNHVVELFYCWRDWCTSQNRWHHEKKCVCLNIETTSQDVRDKSSLGTSGCAKWRIQFQRHIVTTKSMFQSDQHKMLIPGKLKTLKVDVSKAVYKHEPVTGDLSGRIGQNHCKNFCKKLVEGDPKCLAHDL